MRPDHCPMANEPCQSMCDTPCSAHRLRPADAEDMKVHKSIATNYTAPRPAKRVPLTDDEIEEINGSLTGRRDLARLFARAIERAHGIGVSE